MTRITIVNTVLPAYADTKEIDGGLDTHYIHVFSIRHPDLGESPFFISPPTTSDLKGYVDDNRDLLRSKQLDALENMLEKNRSLLEWLQHIQKALSYYREG